MAAFRFVAVSVLAILLLSPFIRTRNTQTFKPIVAIVSDNSESVRNGLGKDSALYKEKLKALADKLGDKYEVVNYTSGDGLRQDGKQDFNDKSTDLSGAIDELNDIYYNRNLGAVILASDGIYNKGINPVYAASKSTYGIYTIAVGDTTIQKDQKLSNAFYNKIAYLNDQFGLRIDVEATNLSGKNTKLSVYEVAEGSNKLLQTKDISYATQNFFQSYDFVIPAYKTGIAHYRIALTNIEGELINKLQEKEKQYHLYPGYGTFNFHNQYVQNFAELGVIGFLLLLLMLFLNTKKAFNSKDFMHIAFAVLMISLFLTESFLWRQRGVLFFMLLYALFNMESSLKLEKNKK